MKAIVLAAGVGSRLDPLTTIVPKPLVPVANRPVMEHILELLKRHGIRDVAANLHYMPEMIRDYFGDGTAFGMSILWKLEKELSGDAGGVRACREFLSDGTFLVMMGDLLTDADLSRILAEHKRKRALATIGVKEVEDVSQFGVVISDSQGWITGFQEKPAPGTELSRRASTGIYVLEPAVFQHIPAEGTYGFGRQLFPQLVHKRLPVLAVDVEGYWSDVGTIEQYRLSNFDAVKGVVQVGLPPAREAPSGGKPALIKAAGHRSGTLLLGRNCRIEPEVEITGTVIVGDDCLVCRGARLHDTVLWPGVRVGAGARLSDTIIGSGATVPDESTHQRSVFMGSLETAPR